MSQYKLKEFKAPPQKERCECYFWARKPGSEVIVLGEKHHPRCEKVIRDEVTPEVCVLCGRYFNYKGGRQCCPSCKNI